MFRQLLKYTVNSQLSYISGHVTDGSSTFTFKVNNQNITVPVDNSGNWKWVKDRDITNLKNGFFGIVNLDYLEVFLPNNPNLTSMYRWLYGLGYSNNQYLDLQIVVNIKKLDTANVTNFDSFFQSSSIKHIDVSGFTSFANGTTFNMSFHNQSNDSLDLRGFEFPKANYVQNNFWSANNLKKLDLGKFLSNKNMTNSNCFNGCPVLTDLTADEIGVSVNFKAAALTKQSVLNIINAAAANVTYTLHSTVYNKCASGGEWYTDIQAAINAKAQQGYTVTLISA